MSSKEGKSYHRNFLTMLSGNTLSQIIPFIIAPILTRIFSPVDFAVFANFTAIAGMLGIVASGRLELAVTLPKEHKKAQDLIFAGIIFTFILGVLSLGFPLFSEQVGQFYDDDILPKYLWLIPLAVISYGFLGLSNNWAVREKRFNSLSSAKVLQSLVNNGLAALFGYIAWGVDGLIIAWLLSQYAGILVLVWGVERKTNRKDLDFKVFKSTVKEYKDFPLINSLHAFTDVFATQFLLFWLISTYFGLFELGIYALMFKYIKAPIALVTTSVSQLFYVEAAECINEGKSMRPIMFKTMKIAGLFAIPFGLGIIFFGEALFSWYLGEEWGKAGVYAQRILPILLITFVLSPISVIPILFKKQAKSYLYSLFCYVVSLGALFVALLLGWNFEDALILYTAGYCVYYFAIFIWYNKLTQTKHAGFN
jgi:O-antigen/teichoic acid export membrane protein|tara:strand:- start:12554 stop:13822 length:1269 start_codon:yes stop_codon:yes gene_type:complete